MNAVVEKDATENRPTTCGNIAPQIVDAVHTVDAIVAALTIGQLTATAENISAQEKRLDGQW